MAEFVVKEKQELTKEQEQRVIDVTAAEDFVKKYYPGFWDRINEDDILHLLTIGHMLYKTNPEYLEATAKLRNTPTQ